MKHLLILLGLSLMAFSQTQTKQVQPRAVPRPSELDIALSRISEGSLRGNLSFLASDVLAGRWTPSKGLDTAAEFIASRFRAAGIEPGNGTDYFQVADLTEMAKKSPELRGRTIEGSVIGRNVIGVLRGSDPVLKNSYVILSAHYDHVGTLKTSAGLTRR